MNLAIYLFGDLIQQLEKMNYILDLNINHSIYAFTNLHQTAQSSYFERNYNVL